MELTPEQVDRMPAGAELDALAAELVLKRKQHEWQPRD